MNKRILSLVAAMTLIMTMFAFTGAAFARSAPTSNYTAYSKCSNGKPLNVRSGPGKEYEIIGSIPYGQEMLVYEDRDDGWSELYWGSIPGFVMTSLISHSYPGPYVNPDPENKASSEADFNSIFSAAKLVNRYTVTLNETKNSKGVANVRWAPSKTATLLKKYPSGTQVTVIAELGKNWYQVEDESGAVGFVNTAYVAK